MSNLHIKKKYATEASLEKPTIAAWQKKGTKRRLKEIQRQSANAVSWNDAVKWIKLLSQ